MRLVRLARRRLCGGLTGPDDAASESDRSEKPEDGTDTRTLLRAPGADLVLLEFAVVIQGGYADRVVLGQTGVFQVGGCGVSGRFGVEECDCESCVP